MRIHGDFVYSRKLRGKTVTAIGRSYRCSNGFPVLLWLKGTSAASPVGSRGYALSGSVSICFLLASLACDREEIQRISSKNVLLRECVDGYSTHVGNSAVCAPADLRLVDIDEDAGVA